MYVERSPSGSIDVDDVGEWSSQIDTAFACLSIDSTGSSKWYPDVLVAGGSGEDGLLCKFAMASQEHSDSLEFSGPNQITPTESIPNWTPLTDLAVDRLSSSRAPNEVKGAALFVANGISPQGSISELRHGLRALIDDSFAGINGCTGLWVIDYGSQWIENQGRRRRRHYATFIITLPLESLVIGIDRIQPGTDEHSSSTGDDKQWNKFQIPAEDEPVEDHIAREEETISACLWSEDYSIQITRKEARFLRRPNLSQTDTISFEHPLLMAASHPAYPFITVVYNDSGRAHFGIIPVLPNGSFDQPKEHRIQLPYNPTCMELFDIDGTHYVFLSTFDSRIAIFEVKSSGALELVLEQPIGNIRNYGSEMLCESAVFLNSGHEHMMVCATRNGLLLHSTFSDLHSGIVACQLSSSSR